MINAASAIIATPPGQPGKGLSPVGGDPFTTPFGLAFDLSPGSAAPVDRGALLNGASRQVAAAAGPALPVLEADAIDPALAWLPAVNIAAPAPLDIPPALAAVPASGDVFVAAPQEVASDGSQALRPAPPRAVRGQSIATDAPVVAVGRLRNAPLATPPAATLERAERKLSPALTTVHAAPTPATELPPTPILVGNMVEPSPTSAAKPDPALADRSMGEARPSADSTIIGLDAASNRSRPVTTRAPVVFPETAPNGSTPIEAAVGASVPTSPGKPAMDVPAADGEANGGVPSVRPGRTPERATTPLAVDENGEMAPTLAVEGPRVAAPQAGAGATVTTDGRSAPGKTVRAVPAVETRSVAGAPEAAIPQLDGARHVPSRVAATPLPLLGDVPRPQQEAETSPAVDLPEATKQRALGVRPARLQTAATLRPPTDDLAQTADHGIGSSAAADVSKPTTPQPDGAQLASLQPATTTRPVIRDVIQRDRLVEQNVTVGVSVPTTPQPDGAQPASLQPATTTRPMIPDVIHADSSAVSNSTAGVSTPAAPQADSARPAPPQVTTMPRPAIDDGMPAARGTVSQPAADMAEAGIPPAIVARPMSPEIATMPGLVASGTVTTGRSVEPNGPVVMPDLPKRSIDADPAAPSVSTGASAPADAPVAEERPTSSRGDDRPAQAVPQHSATILAEPTAERMSAPANPAQAAARAPQIVATGPRPVSPAPITQEHIVIGAVAPASAVANLATGPDTAAMPALPTEGRSRSMTRHPDARIREPDMPAAGAVPPHGAGSATATTDDASEDKAEADDHDVATPTDLPATVLQAAPLAPAPTAEPKAAPVASAQIAIPLQRGVDAPVGRDRRRPTVAPADVPAAEPQIAAQPRTGTVARQDAPRPGTAAMDAPIETGVEARPDVAQRSARPTATVPDAIVAPLPDTGPSVRTGAGDARGTQREPTANPVPARSDVQAAVAPRLGKQPGALPRGALDRAAPVEQPPVTRDATTAAATSRMPASPVADLTARTPASVRGSAPRDTAAADPAPAPAPAPAPSRAAPQAVAVARPVAATPDSTVAAPAAITPATPPAPVALAPQRPAFVREVAGAPRQTVALRPPAAVQPQPAAGTTAPAAQVFGAAMHAAASADDRKPVDRADPAPIAVAAPAELRPVAAASDGNSAPVDMRQDGWPTTMVDRIERLRDAADANDTRIRLVPDALGGIAISVKSVGDALHVRFVADQDATRALIEEAQPQLAAVAEERGLRIGQTVIETASAAQTQGNPSQGNSGGQQPSGQSPSNQQAQTASGNSQPGGQPGAGQAQAQAGQQQQSRQQQPSTARQATAPAHTPSHDTDAAGDGRVA